MEGDGRRLRSPAGARMFGTRDVGAESKVWPVAELFPGCRVKKSDRIWLRKSNQVSSKRLQKAEENKK